MDLSQNKLPFAQAGGGDPWLPGAAIGLSGLAPFAGYAKVAPRYDPEAGAANFGGNVADTSFEFLSAGWPIRQNGTIEQIGIYLPTLTGLTAVYLQIWRLQIGTVTPTYNLVGTSENLLSEITPANATPFALTSPIGSVKQGDWYGLRLEWSAGCTVNNLCARLAQSGVSVFSVSNSSTPVSSFEWEAQTEHVGVDVSINLYMTRPHMVVISDSMMYGGISIDGGTVDYANSIDWAYSPVHYIARPFGYTYQCASIGGETIQDRAARFNADVVSLLPRIAVIYGGTAGLGGTTSTAQFTASYITMLNLCVANNIIPVVFLIFPSDYFTSITHKRLREEWNRLLVDMLIEDYPSAVIVDTEPYLGKYDAAGPDGNLWKFQSLMSFDTLHLTNYAKRIAANVAVLAMSVK